MSLVFILLYHHLLLGMPTLIAYTLDLGKCKTEECGVKSAVHLCRVTPEGILSSMGNDVLSRFGGR